MNSTLTGDLRPPDAAARPRLLARAVRRGTADLRTGPAMAREQAAALIAALTGVDPATVTGRGTGIDDATHAHKVTVVAAHRVPVLLDGVIAGAAALVVARLAPAALDACVAGHRSGEPGHLVALRSLGLVRAAVAALRKMSTFDAAGVTEKSS